MDSSEKKLLPRRPYLFRAFYDWIIDNHLTPLLVVNTTVSGVNVPLEHSKEGKIILNIAMHSVGHYHVDNDGIAFSARFNGNVERIYVPMAAVEAIYARENGVGLNFLPESHYENSSEEETTIKNKALFHVVK